MTLIEPPASASFGFVTGRFALAVADTAQDVDHVPNFVPASGTVTFRPAATKLITTSPTRYVSPQPVTATLNSAGALTDHNGLNGIWLVVGTYSVTFNLAGITVQRFDIAVTAAHIEAAPLDLVMVTPAPIEPTVKFVVNELVYTETLAARDEVVALLEGVEGGMGAGINDAATDTVTTWSSSKINTSLAGKVPTTRTVAGKALSANVTLAKADVGLSNVDNTADASKPVSTAAQAALDAKADSSDLAGYVPTARTVAGKPLTANVTLAKADVGLGSVDNTSDAAKPVSTATQTALNAKADTTALASYVPATRTIAGKALTGNVTLAKADVGLSSVDNTADADKPVSTATATALAAKVSADVAGQGLTTTQKSNARGNIDAASTTQGAKADTAVQPAAIAYMVTSPNDTVRTIERHGSEAAIPTPYVAKRLYLVPDEA